VSLAKQIRSDLTRATLNTLRGRWRVSFYCATAKEARLPLEDRFHDLRHTAGTLALRQGVPLHTVSRMLGHSDPAMTLRRYAHVLEDMREDAARAMDELF
jgi:integrase